MDMKAFWRRSHIIPAVIAAVMLLMSFGSMPSGYYTNLRRVVFAAAIWVIIVAAWGKRWWIIPFFAATAVIFNPIWGLWLDRSVWLVLDVVCAGLFVVSVLYLLPRRGTAG